MASISEFKEFTTSEICRHICLTILRKTVINIRYAVHPIIRRKFVHNILMFIKNMCKKCKHHIWLIKLILLAIKRKSDITCTCSLSCSGVISYIVVVCRCGKIICSNAVCWCAIFIINNIIAVYFIDICVIICHIVILCTLNIIRSSIILNVSFCSIILNGWCRSTALTCCRWCSCGRWWSIDVLFFKFLQYININFVILIISKIVIH